MLQEPMHQTKDDKPQCQATTKKGTRAFCVIFLLLLLLLLCAFHVLRSIDRARLITNPRVCFSTRFSPRRYKNRFPLLRARAFFSPPLSFSPTRCSRGCLFMYMYHRRPVPAPSHGRLQILRATRRRLQVKKKGVPFGVSERKHKKTRERDTAFFCASRDAQNKRERERERERERNIYNEEREEL